MDEIGIFLKSIFQLIFFKGSLGDIVDDYFIVCKGTVIQIDANNRSWKNGPGEIVGFLSLWTNKR